MLACKAPSSEDIAKITCFLVGLVTGDNWQYDHGDNSHKKMTGDNWQNNHRDDSECRETEGRPTAPTKYNYIPKDNLTDFNNDTIASLYRMDD